MATLTYRIGDATAPEAEGIAIIAHVCNDAGGWGAGFVLALSARWRAPADRYREWANKEGGTLPLGMVQLVQVGPELLVANMIAQAGFRSATNPVPLRYDALATCLGKLGIRAGALGASVHMPRIGSGLAGGRWEKIEVLIEEELLSRDVDTTVYDLPGTVPPAT